MSDNLGNIVSGDTLHPLLQLALASRPVPAAAPPQGFFDMTGGGFAPATFTPPQQAAPPPPQPSQPDPSYNPRVAMGPLPKAAMPAPTTPLKSAPPPPMPKPVDTRPDLPGQPGAKEPDPSRWGQDNSPLGRMIDRAMKHLEEQPTIRPPDLKDLPPPVSQQVQNNWMATVLSSAGLLLAAFGSRRSAAPMTAAIKSFGGYLEGYNQGQQEVWKQKQAEYKEQLDYALQRNQLELDRYKIAVEASKGDTEKLHEMLYAASILNEDERGKAELEQGRINEFFKYVDAKQKWWENVQAVRNSNFLSGLHEPEPPEPELPEDLRGYIYGSAGGAGGGGALDIVRRAESSGDWKATGPDTSSGPARGGYQIKDGTWKQYAPPDVQREWPTADQAPPEVQTKVAKAIPVNQWAQTTRDKLHRRFGDFDENQTLGQLEQQHPSGGTQVAGPGGSPAEQPPTATSGAQADTQARTQADTQSSPLDQAITTYIDTGQLPQLGGGVGERFKTAIIAGAGRRASSLNSLLSQIPANATPEQTKAVLAKLDPQTSSIIQSMVDGTYPLPTAARARNNPYWQTMFAIAKRIAPNLDAATYDARKKLIEDVFTGADGKNLTSVATAYQHAKALMDRAGQLGLLRYAGEVPILGNVLTGKALARYKADLDTFAGEYEKALRGTAGSERGIERTVDSLSPSHKIDVLQAAIAEYTDRLRERMKELTTRLGGLGAAGSMQDVNRLFQAYTGEDPAVLSDLERAPASNGGGNQPPWLKYQKGQ